MQRRQSRQFTYYLWFAIIYTLVLAALLLQPFDFSVPFHFVWTQDINGIEFSSPGSIRSSSSVHRLYGDLVSGGGLTLEVWAATKKEQQQGPARIVTFSGGLGWERNFTISQNRRDLIAGFRTTATLDDEGIFRIIINDLFENDNPRHIIVTYNFSEGSVYVDGQLLGRVPTSIGSFSNWDDSYSLVLGNEVTGNRPWLGQLFLVAIYNRALSPQEVQMNYAAGRVFDPTASASNGRIGDGLVAFYPFTEGEGIRVFDRSGRLPPVNLQSPTGRQLPQKYWLLQIPSSDLGLSSFTFKHLVDIIGNIFLFAPLGFLWHVALRGRRHASRKIVVFVLTVGVMLSLSMESLQYFLEERISSMTDVVNNTIGTALGIAVDKLRR